MRNRDIGTVVLHPCIRPHLATELLINCAIVSSFGELVWHRAAHKDFRRRAAGPSFHLNWYADIEAASDPRALTQDNACVFAAQSKVVCSESLDRPFLAPKIFVQIFGLGNISKLVDDIIIFPCGRVKCNWIAVEEFERGGHSSRIALKRLCVGKCH